MELLDWKQLDANKSRGGKKLLGEESWNDNDDMKAGIVVLLIETLGFGKK
jgi:hypothetical protein